MENINFEYIGQIENGINKHQIATLNKTQEIIDYTTESELTVNDIIGVSKAIEIAAEFYDVKAVILTKSNQVTGVALGADLSEAFVKAIDCNPVDALSSIACFTSVVDKKLAIQFATDQLIVAPEFEDGAIEVLKKYSIKYIKLNTPLEKCKNFIKEDILITPLGTIVQEKNISELSKDSFKVLTKLKPTVEQIEDSVFAWKTVKYIKSNAIAVVKNLKTLAIAQGIQSQACEFVMNYACDTAKEAVLASDSPITISDLNTIIQNRVSVMILPEANAEIIKLADKYEKVIITTGFSTSLS